MTIAQTVFMNSGLIATSVAAIVRFPVMDHRFRPFVFTLWVALANEALSLYLIHTGSYNVTNNNVYMLLECLLYCWFFCRFSPIPGAERKYQWLMIFFALAWLAEFLYTGTKKPLFYFNIGYCLFLSLCATRHLSFAFVINDVPFYKNAFLLICFCFVIYFSYRVFLEVSWFYGLGLGKEFRKSVFKMMTWINFVINLLYLYAVIWIPGKRAYITL